MSILITNMLNKVKLELAAFVEANPAHACELPDNKTIIRVIRSQFNALKLGIEAQQEVRLDYLGVFYMAEIRRQALKEETKTNPKKQNLVETSPINTLTTGRRRKLK
jgi:hypothetical protein